MWNYVKTCLFMAVLFLTSSPAAETDDWSEQGIVAQAKRAKKTAAYRDVPLSELIDVISFREFLLLRKYHKADSLCAHRLKADSTDLLGTFGLLLLETARLIEENTFYYSPTYMIYEEAVMQKLKTFKDPSYYHQLFPVAIYGIRSLFNLRNKKYFAMVISAFQAIRRIENMASRKIAPVDSKLGLGNYIYWKAEVFEAMQQDTAKTMRAKKQGIADVIQCKEHGELLGPLAGWTYLYMYTDKKDRRKKIARITDYLSTYPENIVVKQYLTAAYIKKHTFSKALKITDQMIRTAPDISYNYLLKARILIGMKKDLEQAKDLIQNYLQQFPLEKDPMRGRAHFWLAEAYRIEKNYSLAEKNYKRALNFFTSKTAEKRLKMLRSK